VKDHWYHVKLLETLRAESLESREKDLREMQEWLGDDHNLTVLSEKLAAEPDQFGDAPAIAAVTALIDRAQKELRAKSLDAGTRLYVEKPAALTGRFAQLWDAWRRETGVQRKGASRDRYVPRRKGSAA
jgi:hypothetical protein